MLAWVFSIQMRRVCRIRLISRAFKRSRSALWKTTFGHNIPISRHASANYYYDYLHYEPYRHKSSNSCSSYDLWAKRQSKRSLGICCLAAAPSVGHTCHYSSLAYRQYQYSNYTVQSYGEPKCDTVFNFVTDKLGPVLNHIMKYFFTARCYAYLRLCCRVCHVPVLCQNGQT